MWWMMGLSTAIPSFTAPDEPGNVMTNVEPAIPATQRERIAVGVDSSPRTQNA